MLACAIGDSKIDVFISDVKDVEKGSDFKVFYIYVLMDLPNGDIFSSGAIYCSKRVVCTMTY